MGSCASISGIVGSVVGTFGAGETTAMGGAGTLALGATTMVAGKGEEANSKISSKAAQDLIRATVAGPSRKKSAKRVEKDRFDWVTQKSLRNEKEFLDPNKQQNRDSIDKVSIACFLKFFLSDESNIFKFSSHRCGARIVEDRSPCFVLAIIYPTQTRVSKPFA